ncbi:HlyD family efflux transporter periplasmic adaptor subunit [Roseomonas terrae]|uniref:HlyD family efflux transporter periplasmic adaptor subunit n=1 Tax=Neoroseomonas terrae TaxID=424799 RepID=A0ABS5EN51_9PROT|nr:HlyD family efflux transporter periplasmic adaptor subunit [Neoroseomonas terrae]
MTRRGRILAGIAALAIAAGGYAVFARSEATRPAPTVAAAPAGPVGVGALGRVEPASRIRRLTQPGGMAVTRLDRLLVAEGDTVAAGQLLAEFADAPQKDASVAQAEASVAEQRANLERIRAAGRPTEIESQRARVAALKAQEELALREAERSDRLVPTGAGAVAQADRNRAAAVRLTAERRQAEADLDSLLSSRPEDIALAEARLAAAEAALTKAQADAELSRVRAPFAGTILRIIARPGDQVGNDGLLEIGDLTRMDIVADVYETDLPRLREGATAEVVVPGESRRFTATVREIGWTVRRQTQANTDPVAAVDSRTVEVRLALDEAGSEALRRRSNMQVQVAIRP